MSYDRIAELEKDVQSVVDTINKDRGTMTTWAQRQNQLNKTVQTVVRNQDAANAAINTLTAHVEAINKEIDTIGTTRSLISTEVIKSARADINTECRTLVEQASHSFATKLALDELLEATNKNNEVVEKDIKELFEEVNGCKDGLAGLSVQLTALRDDRSRADTMLQNTQVLLSKKIDETHLKALTQDLQLTLDQIRERCPTVERVSELLESRVTLDQIEAIVQALQASCATSCANKYATQEQVQELQLSCSSVCASKYATQEQVQALETNIANVASKYATQEQVQDLVESLPVAITKGEVEKLIAITETKIIQEVLKELPASPPPTTEILEQAKQVFLTRDEFVAHRSIAVTRNDLETCGKGELDELRVAQNALRRGMVTKEQLTLLGEEMVQVQERCGTVENKLEELLAVKAAPPAPLDLTLLPEVKYFTDGPAKLKYLRVGDCRFLLSTGFTLPSEGKVEFDLATLDLAELGPLNSTSKDYSTQLTDNKKLIFTGSGQVKRFMMWY